MRQYERGYDAQLASFREERIRLEEAGYRNHVKITVATLIARGENAQHIAALLEIDTNVITGWYRDLFLNQQDLIFGIDDFTYIREMNKIRADARTKGVIVKGVIEERLTIAAAMEAVGANNQQTIRNWVNAYSRDYDVMTTLPAGTDYLIRTPYALNREDASQIQELIFRNDREENELASRLRETHIANR